jgi:hypothetical protein
MRPGRGSPLAFLKKQSRSSTWAPCSAASASPASPPTRRPSSPCGGTPRPCGESWPGPVWASPASPQRGQDTAQSTRCARHDRPWHGAHRHHRGRAAPGCASTVSGRPGWTLRRPPGEAAHMPAPAHGQRGMGWGLAGTTRFLDKNPFLGSPLGCTGNRWETSRPATPSHPSPAPRLGNRPRRWPPRVWT